MCFTSYLQTPPSKYKNKTNKNFKRKKEKKEKGENLVMEAAMWNTESSSKPLYPYVFTCKHSSLFHPCYTINAGPSVGGFLNFAVLCHGYPAALGQQYQPPPCLDPADHRLGGSWCWPTHNPDFWACISFRVCQQVSSHVFTTRVSSPALWNW